MFEKPTVDIESCFAAAGCGAQGLAIFKILAIAGGVNARDRCLCVCAGFDVDVAFVV